MSFLHPLSVLVVNINVLVRGSLHLQELLLSSPVKSTKILVKTSAFLYHTIPDLNVGL